MKGSFLTDRETPAAMAAVRALLEKVEGTPYVLLYEDGGGTRVVEDTEPEQFMELLTGALLVLGDAYWNTGRQAEYAAWLQGFIDEYGPGGERAVYEELVAQGVCEEKP